MKSKINQCKDCNKLLLTYNADAQRCTPCSRKNKYVLQKQRMKAKEATV